MEQLRDVHKMSKTIWIVFFLLVSFNAFSFLAPDGTDYKTVELKKFRVIYSEDSKEFLERLLLIEEKIIEDFERNYRWALKDRLTVILASDGNQIANAFSTAFPKNINTFYNGGGALLDYFSMQSWLFALASHEGAHAYQLDIKQSISQVYYNVFGSSPIPHIFILVPIFTNPNFLLPTWLIEGNAVFNESRFGNGGRLFSGELRALYCALVKDKKLNEKRLTNNHLFFPYTQEKYIVGGYFFNFLYERFGLEAVNTFYFAQADHWINPFLVNSTFELHFRARYSDLINEFLNTYSNFCHQQKKLAVDPFSRSVFLVPLSDDEQEIWSLASDGKQTPELFVVNKTDETIFKKRVDLDAEKIFKIEDGVFVSNDSKLVGQKSIKFSLWDESGKEVERYRGKIISDMRKDNLLWINPKESVDEQILYYNDKKIGVTHSSAKFDKDLNIYRFIQRKNERILYKNDTPIFSFKSFYAKVVDIDDTGRIYFIGSTDFGSTLFYFADNKFYRAIASDVIVDARKLNDKFLVTEVSSEGYEYKIATLEFSEELPSFYDYKFTHRSEFEIYSNIPSQTATSSFAITDAKDYSMIKNLEFHGGNSIITLADSNVSAYLSMNVADPLEYNQIMLTGGVDRYNGQDSIEATYTLKKYLWDYAIYHHFQKKYPTNANPSRAKENEQESGVGVIVPIIESKNHLLFSSLFSGYEFTDRLHTGYGTLYYQFQKIYGLSFFSYRQFDLVLEHLVKSDGEFENANWSKWSMDVKNETFLSVDLLFKVTNDIELPLSLINNANATPIISAPYSFYSSDNRKQSLRTGLEFKKVVNFSYYFERFPISLRRLAPKTFAHYFYYEDNHSSGNFYEVGVGLTTELLLGHLAPFNISLNYITKEFDENHIVLDTAISF